MARKFKTLAGLFRDPRRWIKSAPPDDCGRHCLLTGIRAVYGIGAFPKGKAVLDDAAREFIGDKRRGKTLRNIIMLSTWNDDPKTTFADLQRVAKHVDATAKRLGIRPATP